MTDRDLRPSHALLNPRQWVGLLSEFGETSAVETAVSSWNTVFLMRKPTPKPSRNGDWLILADRKGVGAALASRLERDGARCVLAHADEGHRDFHGDWRGVVHLWSLDAASTGDVERSSLHAAEQLVCDSTLQVVRSLAKTPPASLWFVTQGACAVGSGVPGVAAAQAPLWGLGRTVMYEHPEFGCRCVDLGPGIESAAEALWVELNAMSADTQVALREAERFVIQPSPVIVDPDARMRLTIPVRGLLDNVRVEPATRRAPGAGEVEVRVDVSGVTFRDVLNVLGLYPGDPGPLGGECTGRVERVGAGVSDVKPGDVVVAVAPGSHDGYVLVPAQLTAPRPHGMSAEEAMSDPDLVPDRRVHARTTRGDEGRRSRSDPRGGRRRGPCCGSVGAARWRGGVRHRRKRR